MKFRRKKREKVDITLISMIDVLFVLLLFFMVSTTFNRHTVVEVKLPEAVGAEAESNPKSITVTIDPKGVYYVAGDEENSRKLQDQSRETLMRELTRVSGQGKDIPFIISADAHTPHQSVMTVLDVAGQIGFERITFATEAKKDTAE